MEHTYEVVILEMVASELKREGIDIHLKVNTDARTEFPSKAFSVIFFPNPHQVREVENNSLLTDVFDRVSAIQCSFLQIS